MYKALINFVDAATFIEYHAGDEVDVTDMTDERIQELSTESNRVGTPLIAKEEETTEETINHPQILEITNEVY